MSISLVVSWTMILTMLEILIPCIRISPFEQLTIVPILYRICGFIMKRNIITFRLKLLRPRIINRRSSLINHHRSTMIKLLICIFIKSSVRYLWIACQSWIKERLDIWSSTLISSEWLLIVCKEGWIGEGIINGSWISLDVVIEIHV